MEFACLIFLGLLGLAYPIERIADEISAYDGVESSIKAEDANAWEIALNFTSNSPVLFDEAGHYRLELQLSTLSSNNGTQDFRATTACFSVGEPPMHLASQLEELTLTRMIGENATTVTAPLKHALYVDVRRFGTGRKLNPLERTNTFVYRFTFTAKNSASLRVLAFKTRSSTTGCIAARTVSKWTDVHRWSGGAIPSPTDSVEIPARTGRILLEGDVAVQTLTMLGGELVAHQSQCPDGYSASPFGTHASKCYRLFENVTTYGDAEFTCQRMGVGALGAHLVHIDSYDELGLVKGLCRSSISFDTSAVVQGLGDSGQEPEEIAGRTGCYIGLRDFHGVGDFQWEEPASLSNPGSVNSAERARFAVGTAFRDWRRIAPNNMSYSEGHINKGGERCVYLAPWEKNPWGQEEGLFEDVGCQLPKAFVCQSFSTTTRTTLTVGTAVLQNGSFVGGHLDVTGSLSATHYAVRKSATLHLAATSGPAANTLSAIVLSDGAVLEALAGFSLRSGLLGEAAGERAGMQSQVRLGAGVTMTVEPQARVEIGAWLEAGKGAALQVGSGAQLSLAQGGDLATSSLALGDPASRMHLGGSGARLVTYDAFDVRVAHKGPVLGEYAPLGEDEDAGKGVFRLRVTVPARGTTAMSECIRYDASETEMRQKLDALEPVAARGGVTVRRGGSGTDPMHYYGYTWRVELDETPTTALAEGPLNLELHCYGILEHSCGCAETKIPLRDTVSGQSFCVNVPENGNNSRVDGNACAMRPTELRVERLTQAAYMQTQGMGDILVTGGTHRMPPRSNVAIHAAGGIVMVAGDQIDWYKLSASKFGKLKVLGIGWESWESSILLYRPGWATNREYSVLNLAPAFNMSSVFFMLQDSAQLLLTCPGSSLYLGEGSWDGGVIAGRATVFISRKVTMETPTVKALREDCTLVLDEGALMTWRNGDVTFANGADLVVRGTLETDNNGTTGHFGQAQLIAPSASALADPRLMVPYSILRYLSTSTYYKPGMDIELAPMDYINPLCGGACRDTSQVYIRDKGSVVQRRGSRAIFVVALNFLDESTMAMENNVFTALNSGGELGNKAVVTVGTGSTLSLDGGKLLMRPLSNIKGDGELIVLSGEHEVASVVTAHITISGGTLLWPFTAGDGETITFDGGLRVNNTGKLQINPWSTQIIVKKLVEIWNESQVIFPAIGIADQPSQSDRVDAPDASPRGRFLATERFDLMGGTLQGKTDFVSEKFLFMGGGEKKIRFLAKVINQGLAVWEQGDIISENQGDFLNFGTLELYDSTTFSASAFIEGRVIPLENGGDYFAKRFHSSDMDEGRLNYTEYVLLRTEVVSRAPLGWTEDLQDDDTTRNDL